LKTIEVKFSAVGFLFYWIRLIYMTIKIILRICFSIAFLLIEIDTPPWDPSDGTVVCSNDGQAMNRKRHPGNQLQRLLLNQG